MRRAIPRFIAAFDALVESWGWSELAKPEPDRNAYREVRITAFRDAVERPYYEAAVTLRAAWQGLTCPYDTAADEGEALGFTASMDPEEAGRHLADLQRTFFQFPRLGAVPPDLDDPGGELYQALARSIELIEVAVEAAEREITDQGAGSLRPDLGSAEPAIPSAETVTEPPPQLKEVKPKRPSALNRALAVALDFAKKGKPLQVAAIAQEVGCSREYLSRNREFRAFLESLTRRGAPPRGSKVEGRVEAWREEQDDDA